MLGVIAALLLFRNLIADLQLAIIQNLRDQTRAASHPGQGLGMSQARQVRARFTQAQPAQSHRPDLKLAPDESIQAHAFSEQIAARFRGREFLPALPLVGFERFSFDQGDVALARVAGKRPGSLGITITFQAMPGHRPDPFDGVR